MTLIDISVPLTNRTPEWPGDTPFSCRWTWEIAAGDSVNVSAMTLSPHVGTHADAPVHVQNGWSGAEALPLGAFLGRARVVGVPGQTTRLELADLGLGERDPVPARLLLRTGRTVATGTFPEEWPALSESCARSLVAGGLRLLGVDAPSVDPRESRTLDVHRILFGGGACLLENLDLREARDGDYDLVAAPLRVEGLDAAPVRAVLRPFAAS
ncbi:MAG TPA: cyclase family protein [Gemmatimonadaceae bacterium]|nr:cyclase family protein [Gemmatimonadaceae bacterium]